MKILWFINKAISGKDSGASGTWLDAMADRLAATGDIDLGAVSFGDVEMITRRDPGRICQWVVPYVDGYDCLDGLPARRIIAEIIHVIEEFSPDLIHIWGTEYFWGIITSNRMVVTPSLLEIQGLKGLCSRVFRGGLSFLEQIGCLGPMEIIGKMPHAFQEQLRWRKWGLKEDEMIAGHRFICAQSDMTEEYVKSINSACRIFRNDRMLRSPFYEAEQWRPSGGHAIFCSSAYSVPYKGLHTAIRAISILKKKFPSVQLRIAGPWQEQRNNRSGYMIWLNREINRLKIDRDVVWLGVLDAGQLISEMRSAAAMVLPSFIETYCVGLAEAMMIGLPSAVSWSGGTSYLAKDEDSALFFPPGDEVACAVQLERLITDKDLSWKISGCSRELAFVRNDWRRILHNQIEIYREILDSR